MAYRVRMSDASFSRLLTLLRMIPSHPRAVDTPQLEVLLAGAGYEISPRTVQRDLVKLEGMGFGLECVDDSKPFRWRFKASAKPMLVPGLDIPQALALLLVEAHLSRLLPRAAWAALRPHIDAARARIDGKPARRWLERVRVVPRSQPLQPPNIDVTILDVVQVALLDEHAINVQYRRPDGEGTNDLVLHPLGLIIRDSVTYVVATAYHYDDVRLYALHRMRSAASTGEKARKPATPFDLDAYLAAGEPGWRLAKEPIHLEVAFFDGAARSVMESPLASDQVVKDVDGVVVVKATVNDTRVLRSWLLGFGASVEVKRPKALRDDMKASLSAAAARYGA